MARTMPTHGVGLLVALTIVIAAGTLAQDLRFDSALARERALARTIDRDFGSLSITIANLRAAQAGYVAAGQDADYWITQVNTLSGELETAIRRRQTTATLDTRKHHDAAATALAAFVAVDGRARAQVRADQKLLASDLIYMDSMQALTKLTGALDGGRSAEVAASEARVARLRMLRFGLNAVAVGFVVAVALFFWRGIVSQPAQLEPVESIGLMPSQARIAPPPALAPPPPQAPPAPAVPGLSLVDAAALCGDLAKVVDTRDVPPLFERAAAVLSAKGVVLWVADPTGGLLKPSLTHGYSDRVVAKLGNLTMDADNLTSLAYRSMRPQSVSGGAPGSPGAIAVPLLASSGCVGVLAAETRQQQPGTDVVPVAQMIAAQFAALVAPTATPGQKTG